MNEEPIKSLDEVLEDLAARADSGWTVIVEPTGDRLGYIARLLIGDGQITAGRATDLTPTPAMITAVYRGIEQIEFAIETEEEEIPGEGLT